MSRFERGNVVADYQHLTDDEVLQIANELAQLTDDARTVLDSELARRKLSIEDVRSQKLAYLRALRLESARTQHRLFNGWPYDGGIGVTFIGKRNLRQGPSEESEEYETTRWFAVFWFPVFPIASFTVRRFRSRWLGLTLWSTPAIIARHPRNWEQILLTWVKAVSVVLALWLAYLYLIYHPELLRRIFK